MLKDMNIARKCIPVSEWSDFMMLYNPLYELITYINCIDYSDGIVFL